MIVRAQHDDFGGRLEAFLNFDDQLLVGALCLFVLDRHLNAVFARVDQERLEIKLPLAGLLTLAGIKLDAARLAVDLDRHGGRLPFGFDGRALRVILQRLLCGHYCLYCATRDLRTLSTGLLRGDKSREGISLGFLRPVTRPESLLDPAQSYE